ncbi:MAG: hypothetical protein OXJ53_10825 [Gammaproteobacteria bacterium]|nr:hypothetical protein [Gammaproteobacteria bacterium]
MSSDEKRIAFIGIALPVVVLAIPLGLWRVAYRFTDWAALFLVPLALVLFIGFHRPLTSVLRAKFMAVVQHDSPIATLATGKVRAAAKSILFVASAVFVLAWHALEVNAAVALVLLTGCVVASCMAVYIPRWAQSHFRGSFARHYGIAFGSAATAVFLVPVLAWVNWIGVDHPGEFRSMELREAMLFWLEERLPDRRGWIAETLAWAYAVEATQISLVAKFGLGSVWAPIYSFYLGLVGFLVARSSAAVSGLVQSSLNQRTVAHPTQESATENAGTALRSGNRIASRSFWGTIALLAVATIGAAIVGKSSEGQAPQSVEVAPTRLEDMLSASAELALQRIAPDVDDLLKEVYAPVYANIPAFASFHYSIVGEYTELLLMVRGQMEGRLHNDLFGGFEDRLQRAVDLLDHKFVASYQSALDEKVREMLAAGSPGAVLGEATELALNDAVDRARITAPIAGTVTLVSGGGVTALTAGVAKTLSTKVAAKAAAKVAFKGSATLGAAGTGAALCAWTGPVAVACGMFGGLAAWLMADAAIVNLDEIINRSEFETELRSLVDGHRTIMKQRLKGALASKSEKMDRVKKEIVADFRLRDLRI